jgi:hypothetical protein
LGGFEYIREKEAKETMNNRLLQQAFSASVMMAYVKKLEFTAVVKIKGSEEEGRELYEVLS